MEGELGRTGARSGRGPSNQSGGVPEGTNLGAAEALQQGKWKRAYTLPT